MLHTLRPSWYSFHAPPVMVFFFLFLFALLFAAFLLTVYIALVTVLFPHRSILLFFHTQCLLTWRGRRLYTNTAYLFIRTTSSFCFFDLSMDLANS